MFKNCYAQELNPANCVVKLSHSKSPREILVSLIFVDTVVQNNMHSNVTKEKQFLSVAAKLLVSSSS